MKNSFLTTLTIFFCLLNISLASATAQIPDYLIRGKDTIAIQSNPLEPYFEKNPIKQGIITSVSSGLWRGYIAYFKFENKKLVVENIYKRDHFKDENGDYHERLISIYYDVFGEKLNFECSFFSGVLICPIGKIIQYVHMGYSSIYERYNLIEVNEGIYIKEKEFTHNEFMDLKIKYFEKFKKTEEYKKILEETINSFKESDKELENEFKDLKKENNKRKKQNKYLYEKEKEIEHRKSAEGFLFLFITNNIKTIDITN